MSLQEGLKKRIRLDPDRLLDCVQKCGQFGNDSDSRRKIAGFLDQFISQTFGRLLILEEGLVLGNKNNFVLFSQFQAVCPEDAILELLLPLARWSLMNSFEE